MAVSPTFSRRKVLALTNATANASVWDFDISGDYMYIAADTDGFYIINITDPANPTFHSRVNIPQPTTTGNHTGAGPTDAVLVDSGLAAANRLWDESPNQQWAPAGEASTAQNLTDATSGPITANTTSTVTATGVTWDNGDAYQLDNPRSFYLPITDVLVIGSMLFLCGRNVGQTNPSLPAVGILAAFSIATPQTPVWQSSYRPDSMDPIPEVGDPGSEFYGNEWYQGMRALGADHIALASQLNGCIIIDKSTPTAMTQAAVYGRAEMTTNYPDPPNTGLIWETSQVEIIEYPGGDIWAFFAQHINGIFALNVTTATSPTNGQWYDSPVVMDPVLGSNVILQARNVAHKSANGKEYLISCHNVSNNYDSTLRGIVVRDVTDPTTATPNSYLLTSMSASDVDTWNDQGDQPDMGVVVYGDIAVVANGQRGSGIFDISDPENAIYLGLQGTDLLPGTNLYKTFLFDKDGATYAYYGDAKETPQLHNLYADQVYIRGPMAIEIGLKNVAASVTKFVNLTSGMSSGVLLGRPYFASQGDVIDTLGGTFTEAGGARTYNIQLHTFDPASAQPLNPVGDIIIYAVGIGSAVVSTEQAISPFTLTAGLTYVVCLSQTVGGGNGLINGVGTSGYSSRTGTTTSPGVFTVPWVTSGTIGDWDCALYALGYNSSSGGSGGIIGSFIK